MKDSDKAWFEQSVRDRYSYEWKWMGRPIIQYPQDIVAFQEIVMEVRPDLIIETGVAHGGSLCLSASLLWMLGLGEEVSHTRIVLGVEVDLRDEAHNALNAHPLRHMMDFFEGSSVSEEAAARACMWAGLQGRTLVCLDSNHTHAHVLAELNAYAPLVSPGSYCIVYDTCIEDLPSDLYPDRPWGVGNNPMTAVREWLPAHPEFEIEERHSITTATYLRRKA